MKLLQIDGLNVVRRVYEANPAPDSPEKIVGVTTSVLGSFKRALKTHTPTHALAPFDYGGSTWRHAIYPAYRENRKPMPDILKAALPDIQARITSELGIKTVAIPNVEADDVLAAVHHCWMAFYPMFPSVILSTDKDLTALVAQGAQVFDHFKKEWRDAAWIADNFGVRPDQVQDFLALMGDSVDGVPGVPGVGIKTAQQWLATHGTLEQLLLNGVPGKKGETLKANAELARLSRVLIGFDTSVKVGMTFRDIRL